jgi:hypothetical protein
MFRIRKIMDDVMPGNKAALGHVPKILKSWFAGVPAKEIDSLGEKLRNPFKQRFVEVLFECPPDDENKYSNIEDLKGARAGLRFYERYGALPIIGTDYQRPIKLTDTCTPTAGS